MTARAIAQAALNEATVHVLEEDYAAAVRTLTAALKACVAEEAANAAPAGYQPSAQQVREMLRMATDGASVSAIATDLGVPGLVVEAHTRHVTPRRQRSYDEPADAELIEAQAYAREHGPEVPYGASTHERAARFACEDDARDAWFEEGTW